MLIILRLLFMGVAYEVSFGLLQVVCTNADLVAHLKEEGFIRSPEVESIMLQIDRANFIDINPYDDIPKFIGYGVSISSPRMHATALEQLLPQLRHGAKVLDVGSGSGYLTACFSKLVGSQGLVVGIDHIERLVEKSVENIKKIPEIKNLYESGALIFKVGDGRNGFPDLAPYDAINVGAASRNTPQTLIDQLKVGGVLVGPVGHGFNQIFMRYVKLSDGTFEQEQVMPARYVPLTDKRIQLQTEYLFLHF